MSGQFWLTHEQVERLRPHVHKVRGKTRSDDRMVLSGIVHVKRNGLCWRKAPGNRRAAQNPFHNRFVRWSRLSVVARIVR